MTKSRVKMTYPNGSFTYAVFHDVEGDPHFMMNRTRWEMDEIAKANLVATVNSPQLQKKLRLSGIDARPSPVQATITISVDPDNRKTIREKAKEQDKSVSAFIEEIVMKHIKKMK